MSTLPLRAAAVAAVFVSLTAALLPLPTGAQPSATPQWGSYLGGAGGDHITAVTQQGGNIIVVGWTSSAGLGANETTGTRSSQDDVFVARFDSDGSILSTPLVFGGTGIDKPLAFAVGPSSELYIVGQSDSPTFTSGAVHKMPPASSGTHAFLSKVAANNQLEWTLFLSGNMDEAATGVIVANNKAYVSGWTNSTDFMGGGSLPPSNNGFVVQIDLSQAGGPAVGWGLLPVIIGGAGIDMLHGITLGGTDKIYVAGTTSSTGFPYGSKVLNTFKGGTSDAIVAKLDMLSGDLDWLTFVGGGGADEGAAIATGATQSFVIAGTTSSPGNLGSGAPLPQTNAFVAWLRPDGKLKFSEVRSGSGNDVALAVTIDSGGNAYVGGRTASSDFEGVASSGFDTAIETGTGVQEGFVWMAPPEGGQGWASFVGGNMADEVTSLSLRESNRLILGMETSSAAAQLPGPPGASSAYDGTLSTTPDGYFLSVGVVDLQPPMEGTVYDRPQQDPTNTDISTTTSTNSLFANWTGFSDNHAITKYEWALGTPENPTSLQQFTSVALNTSAAATGLSLMVGQTYVVTVRATNRYGLTQIAQSDGVLVTYSDGGVPPPVPDAGTPDSGTDTPDSGTGNPDGGPNPPDAGSDGGTTGPGDGDGGGGGDGPDSDPSSPIGWDVGCASGGGAAPLFLGLLALVLLGRRLRTR